MCGREVASGARGPLRRVHKSCQGRREDVAEYNRRYRLNVLGMRPKQQITCSDCGRVTTVYANGVRCGRCHTRFRELVPAPECADCGIVFARTGTQDRRCPDCRSRRHAIAERERSRRRGRHWGGTPALRRAVFNRDGWKCHLCQKKIDAAVAWPNPWSASVDHIIPIAVGGTDEFENLAASHLRCNTKKGRRIVWSAPQAHRTEAA